MAAKFSPKQHPRKANGEFANKGSGGGIKLKFADGSTASTAKKAPAKKAASPNAGSRGGAFRMQPNGPKRTVAGHEAARKQRVAESVGKVGASGATKSQKATLQKLKRQSSSSTGRKFR
jgi:hypothetical protein